MKITTTLLTALAAATLTQGQIVRTIYVDCGDANGTLATDGSGNTWNALINPDTVIADLLHADGSGSGISVSRTSDAFFGGDSSWGVSATDPGDLGVFANDAFTADHLNFRTEDYGPGELTFTGLDTGKAYTLTIFTGSDSATFQKATGGQMDFTATGTNVVSNSINSYKNYTDLLILTDVYPNGSGEIALYMEASSPALAGYNTTYGTLNAFSLMYSVPEPSAIGLILGSCALFTILSRRRRR